MPEKLLLGIDVGTSGLKTVLLEASGTVLASSGVEYPTQHRHPGWAEHDPEDWWKAACQTIGDVLARTGADAGAIAAVATSGLAPTMLPLDKSGRPLAPAAIWADKRAEPQCEWIRQNIGEEAIARLNGTGIDSFFVGPKLLWLREHDPQLLKDAHTFIQANSYINFRLCEVLSLTYTNLTMFLMADVATGGWSSELVEAFGVPVEKLPPIHPAHMVIGEVTTEAARQTGLVPGTAVLAGTVDTAAAALGVGSARVGQCFASMGTGLNLCLCARRPLANPAFICFPHAVPDVWLIDAVMTSTGASLKWFRNQLGEPERSNAQQLGLDPYDLMTLEAAHSQPGAGGLVFLPYVMGELAPIYDADARGVFFGISMETTKGDMVRAVLEGTAMGLRQNLDGIEASGNPVSEVRAVGGATHSELWNQIHADILGKDLGVAELAEGAALGDAILAGFGVGIYPSIEEAAVSIGRLSQVYHPRSETQPRYDEMRSLFARLYPELKGSFAQAAGYRRMQGM